jgi:hypothetical protein
MKSIIVFLIAVTAFAVTVAYVNSSPPYEREVRDWYDLQAVRYYLDEDFILMNDLDSTTAGYTRLASPTANRGKGWLPIGTAWEPFAGTFDGQGYEIRDLFIDRTDKDKLDWNIGLFGRVHTRGTIKNVGVVNVNIIGWWCVGGLVGNNWGTVSNSYSTGNVTGLKYAGGLVGSQSYGTVSNSYSTSNVTGTSHSGGLVGLLYVGTVENSFKNSFWDTETSGMEVSYGGIGKNTTEMQDIATFSGAGWNITAVANPSTRNPSHIWNIVDDETYPFLSWEPVS